MADLWAELGEKAKEFAGSWASYAAIASFGLYLTGYLALRWHLTALGIGTDLNVLDERYLFAGARFIVYLFATIPIVVMLGIILYVAYWVIFLACWIISRILRRLFTKKAKAGAGEKSGGLWERRRSWLTPNRLAFAGVLVTVLLIQLVMRQCFFFTNLLLTPQPKQHWMLALLLEDGEELRVMYFSGLVAGVLLSSSLFFIARSIPRRTTVSQLLMTLLAFLIAVQFLLLPVTYGVLIADKELPKVSNIGGGEEALKKDEEAWLVWEGNEALTYLVRGRDEQGCEKRKLVSLPKKDLKKTEIVQYDRILRVLFLGTR